MSNYVTKDDFCRHLKAGTLALKSKGGGGAPPEEEETDFSGFLRISPEEETDFCKHTCSMTKVYMVSV